MPAHPSVVFVLPCLLALASCAPATSGSRAVFPTRGKLLFKGEPATGALVVLHPLSATADWPRGFPCATVSSQGDFHIHTYGRNDGAPAGDYAVLVLWNDVASTDGRSEEGIRDRLEGKYTDPATTPLRARVNEQATELPTIQLP